MRTWHAATGTFRVEAELLDVREDKVQLRKGDGTSIWVPIDKLSLSDVRFVKAELTKARQALMDVAQGATAVDGTKAATKADPENPFVITDAENPSAAGKKPVEQGNANSFAPPRPNERLPFAGITSVNLVLGQVSNHEMTFTDVLSPWVAIRKHGPGGSLYQVFNLRTGNFGEPFPVDGHASRVALSPDGQTFAALSSFPGKITLYSTSQGKKISEIVAASNAPVAALLFPNADQLLVVTSFNAPWGLYDVATGSQLRTINVEQNFANKYALSSDGKLLAISGQPLVAIYELQTGKRKDQIALVTDSNQSLISVEGLAFCSDDTELAVVGGSPTSEFQVFSVATGKPSVKHKLNLQPMNFAQPSLYRGPAIESLPGAKGYMLFGCAMVDRETGGPVWIDKLKNHEASEFRVLIDDKRQLMLTGPFGARRFEIVDLPWSDINRSKEIVAKGGSVEDAGLPAVKKVTTSEVAIVEPALRPALFKGRRLSVDAVKLADRIPIERQNGLFSQALFAAPSTGKCLSIPAMLNNKAKREVQLFDLKAGRVESTIDVQFLSQVTDISPSGRWLLGTTGRYNDRIDLFDLEKQGEHVVGFRPDSQESAMGWIANARFLSDKHLVTSARGSEAIVWQLPELHALYKVVSFGPVFRFPSSPLFLHRSHEGWCVRNIADGKLVGILESGEDVSQEILKTVVFRQDESACVGLAVMGDDRRLIAWDLVTGKRTTDIAASRIPQSREMMNRQQPALLDSNKLRPADIGLSRADGVYWAGENQVLLRWVRDNAVRFENGMNVTNWVYSLYSLTEQRVLWDYRLPGGAALEGGLDGQLWFVEADKSSAALVRINVPTELASAEIAKAPAAKPLLGRGESVMVDLRLMVSGDKLADGLLRDQAFKLVEQHLKSKNVNISERAAVKLSIIVDRFSADGPGYAGSRSSKLLVHCQLTDISNNVLWQRAKTFEAARQTEPGKAALADDSRRQQWDSALQWLERTVDPQLMLESWHDAGLGESQLSSKGEQLIELRVKR